MKYRIRRWIGLLCRRGMAIFLCLAAATCQAAPPVAPFESPAQGALTELDRIVWAKLQQQGIQPAHACSDEVFIRRVYLDMIGTLPDAPEVRRFLSEKQANKRAELIERLFRRDEFADYWTMRWCDTLRVKSEFPINLWPNAVQAYHRWILDSIRQNRPYDQFARDLLTSSGSNFRVAPVNFYRAVQGREPAAIAEAVALTFMGSRFAKWPEPSRTGMAKFFSRIAYKPTGEWKEEIVCFDPNSTTPLTATFPDGKTVVIKPTDDPRTVFANWLITPGNPWFSRAAANRTWAWIMGRGIVHEPDDLRADNPPSNPELLDFLQRQLIQSNYDMRQLMRIIFNSRTYQLSSIPQSTVPQAQTLFASYPLRRVDAEVLIDAICKISGAGEGYQSPIPEPFTFVPEGRRTISLSDGSIGSSFLELFGRPSRDTGLFSERNNQPTDAQLLHLLNSTNIQKRLQNSWRLRQMSETSRRNTTETVNQVYLTILSRFPTQTELTAASEGLGIGRGNAKQAVEDLAWTLINTKEFLYRH